MTNATVTPAPQVTATPGTFDFPDTRRAAGLIVEYLTPGHTPVTSRLRDTLGGTRVTARGAITSVQVHGRDDEPKRATLVLTDNTGQNAVVTVPAETYAELHATLRKGAWAQVVGRVVRFHDPAFIRALSVRAV